MWKSLIATIQNPIESTIGNIFGQDSPNAEKIIKIIPIDLAVSEFDYVKITVNGTLIGYIKT